MDKILVLQIEDRTDNFLQQLMDQNKKICLENDIKYINLKTASSNVPPYWGKVFEIQKLMSNNEYDYIFWLDSDAFFYNFNKKKIDKLLDKYSNYSFIITADMPPWDVNDFNAGAFIVKNNNTSRDIINKWLTYYHPEKWRVENNKWVTDEQWAGPEYEQGSFIKYIYNSHYRKYIKQLPFYILNNNNCTDNNSDIIITHLAGYHKKNKINITTCIDSFNQTREQHIEPFDSLDNNKMFLFYLFIIILLFFCCKRFFKINNNSKTF